jgi:hypothetical protein
VAQAFASVQRLSDMVARVRAALREALPRAVEKMKLYLNNPATHAILFKPIKSNIAEAHGQARLYLINQGSKAKGQVLSSQGAVHTSARGSRLCLTKRSLHRVPRSMGVQGSGFRVFEARLQRT